MGDDRRTDADTRDRERHQDRYNAERDDEGFGRAAGEATRDLARLCRTTEEVCRLAEARA